VSEHNAWTEIHLRASVTEHAERIHMATTQPAGAHSGFAPWDDDPCGWTNVGECRAVQRLRWARWLVIEAAQLEEAAVIEAREKGVSWHTIGDAFGTTKQAAWERYGSLGGGS
jgi:hypothetical protein